MVAIGSIAADEKVRNSKCHAFPLLPRRDLVCFDGDPSTVVGPNPHIWRRSHVFDSHLLHTITKPTWDVGESFYDCVFVHVQTNPLSSPILQVQCASLRYPLNRQGHLILTYQRVVVGESWIFVDHAQTQNEYGGVVIPDSEGWNLSESWCEQQRVACREQLVCEESRPPTKFRHDSSSL